MLDKIKTSRPHRHRNAYRLSAISGLLLTCAGMEYYFQVIRGTTEVYTHTFYIPVLIAALWWGFRGGLAVSLFLGCLHTLPEIHNITGNILSRSIMFIAVGAIVGIFTNKHKQAIEQLQKEKALTESTINSLPGIFYIFNDENELLRWNENFEKVSGYSAEDISQRSIFDFFESKEKKNIAERIEEVFSSGETEVEANLVFKNGEKTPYFFTGSHLNMDDKSYLLGIGIDISKLKQVEGDLRRARQDWEDIFQAIVHPTLILDKDRNIKAANRATLKAVGKEAKEVIGKKCYQVLHKHDQLHRNCPLAAKDAGDSFVGVEMYMKAMDGTFLVNCTPVFDSSGESVQFIHIATDISERRKAQQELLDTNEILERIFSTTYMSIAYMDTDFNFIRVNRAYAETAGQDTRFFIGRNHFDIYPDKEILAIFYEVVSTGRVYTEHNKPFVIHSRKEKAETMWSWSIQPIKDTRGKVEGLLLCLIDITEQKHAEDKLLTYQKQLQTLACEISQTEEQERRKIAEDLHDSIGQTLAFTQIKLEMLREETRSTDMSEAIKDVSILIKQIIGKTHSLIFQLSPPVLHELGIEAALEWLTEQIEQQHDLKCIFENNEDTRVPLDTNVSVALFRAVRELLTNVVKHAKANCAKVNIRKNHTYLHITVEDDGVGFNSSHIEEYHNNATYGYGLFNIRERLRQMGGQMDIEASPHRGSLITLQVPLKTDIDDKERPDKPADQPLQA